MPGHNLVINNKFPVKLAASSGRVRLDLQAERMGRDLLILFTGGAAHIGAVALADEIGTRSLQRRHHRESEIAESLAAILADAFGCAVTVICGIHYDNINKKEIGEVLRLADELRDKLINWAHQNRMSNLPKPVK